MSFELEENFGEAGAGMTTPQDPSIDKVMEGMNGMLDAALLNMADLSGTGSSLGNVTATGVAEGSDLTVTGIASEDTILSVLVLENGSAGNVTGVKSISPEKAKITGADSVELEGMDTTDDLVHVTFVDAR